MAAVATSQVAESFDATGHESAQGDDGQGYVDVEDLLAETLVGVHRGPQKDQRVAGHENQDRCDC